MCSLHPKLKNSNVKRLVSQWFFVLNSSFGGDVLNLRFQALKFSNAQYILGKNYIENLKIREKQNFMLSKYFSVMLYDIH